jgi:hypothetical protein
MGQDEASLGQTYHEVTDRLMKGESADRIERDITSRTEES